MKIAWVVPCRYVEVNDNLATIVGGGIDRIWVPSFPPPGPVQILCATRIVAGHDEIDEQDSVEPEHELACRVYGPSMQLASELKQPMGISGEIDDPTVDAALIIPIGVVFMPEEPGTHTIEISVDGRGVSVPLAVVVGPPA